MFRRLAIVSLGIVMLASTSPARADIPPEVMKEVTKLAVVVGFEAAKAVGSVLVDVAVVNTTKKYSSRVISATFKNDEKPEAYMAIRMPAVEIVMMAGESGKVIFADSSNATIRMEQKIEVNVFLLYPIEKIRTSASGEIVLPPITPENMAACYLKPIGQRGAYKYDGEGIMRNILTLGGWSEDQKEIVSKALAYDALEEAKKRITKEDIAKAEALFKSDSMKEFERLMTRRTKLEKAKRPHGSKPRTDALSTQAGSF
jgi:hypothetical protein